MTTATNCHHDRTTSGDHFGYTGSVAVHPHTHQNRAAHGGVTYTERCLDCRAVRPVNTNGGHVEVGPWRRPRVEIPAYPADTLIHLARQAGLSAARIEELRTCDARRAYDILEVALDACRAGTLVLSDPAAADEGAGIAFDHTFPRESERLAP